MSLFSLLPLPWKIGIVSILIAAIGFVYSGWHSAVHKQGYMTCRADQEKAVKEGEKLYDKTSIAVQRLPDDALRREFCKWVRDADMSSCLKSLAPFLP